MLEVIQNLCGGKLQILVSNNFTQKSEIVRSDQEFPGQEFLDMVDLISDEFLKYSCCFCSSFHSYKTLNKLTLTNCTLKSSKFNPRIVLISGLKFVFCIKYVTKFYGSAKLDLGVLVQNHPLYLQYKERKLLTTSEELVTSRASSSEHQGRPRARNLDWGTRAPSFNNNRAPPTPDWLQTDSFTPLKVAIWMTFIRPGKKLYSTTIIWFIIRWWSFGKLNISLTLALLLKSFCSKL